MPGNLDNLRVVLVATRNPLNIGAAARAMRNFGAVRLRVVNPYEASFREARSAVGAADVLADAGEFTSVAEAVADCHLVVGTTAGGRRELQLPLRRLDVSSRTIRSQLKTGPVALLFGSEKRGLSNDDMSHCHWLVRIPTQEEQGSMNLGQAVAVCLYELARSTQPPTVRDTGEKTGSNSVRAVLAHAEDLERLTQLLMQTLHTSGYVKPRVAAATEQKVRRLLRRMNLAATDADLWLGMLRQIAWKLSAPESEPR